MSPEMYLSALINAFQWFVIGGTAGFVVGYVVSKLKK